MLQTSYSNAYETQLTADMLGTDLTAQVQTTDGAPSSPCYLVIDPHNDDKREYALFDGTFGATSFVTTALANRYLDGSAAASGITHAAGAIVRFAPVAQHFRNIQNSAVWLDEAQTITGAKTFSVDPTLADGSSALSLTEGNAAYQPRQAIDVDRDHAGNFAAAVAAAVAGDTIVLGDGTYACNNVEITVNNLTIQGQGPSSTILNASTLKACGLIAIDQSGLVIRDLRINGSGQGEQPANVANPTAANFVDSGSGIVLAGCTDSLVDNVYLYNHGGLTGVSPYNGVAGVFMTKACERVTVRDSTGDTCRAGFNDDNYFLATGGAHNKFIGNTAVGCRFGFGFDNGVTGGGVQVIGNTAIDCQQSGFDVNRTQKMTLIGNHAENCGIETSNSGFMVYNGSVYITLAGNAAVGNRGNGFKFDNTRFNTVVGNHSDFNYRHGYLLDTNAHENTLTGNTTRQNSQGTHNTYDNYHVVNGSSRNTLSANVSRRDTAAAAQPRYGLRIHTADAAENELWGNNLNGSGATSDYSNAGGNTISVRRAQAGTAGVDGPLLVERSAAGAAAHNLRATGDAEFRHLVLADGQHQWGTGAAARDTTLYRERADVLALGANDCFKTGSALTASRPSAATVGVGAQFYDSSLVKPIWSDGTNWRDASGTVV